MNWLLVSVFSIFQTKENMLFLNPLIHKSHKQLTSVLKPGAIKTLDEIEMYLRQNFLLRAPRGFFLLSLRQTNSSRKIIPCYNKKGNGN